MLDAVLAATEGLDVAVVYTNTPRPFDLDGLRVRAHHTVVVVEPYLAGTSARVLAPVPGKHLHLGVGRADARRYGEPADHTAWHGLDPAGLRRSISEFVGFA
jgi:transketolase